MEKIKVKKAPKQLMEAIRLIDKFCKKNDIAIDYSVELDYSLEDCYGCFGNTINSFTVRINPSKIGDVSDCKGYLEDYSLFGVVIHEMSHLFIKHLNLLKEYKKEFPEKLIINANSSLSNDEEFAEVFSLYLTNPYLLKNIDKHAFEFMKELFHSPTTCSKKKYDEIASKWKKEYVDKCFSKWNI